MSYLRFSSVGLGLPGGHIPYDWSPRVGATGEVWSSVPAWNKPSRTSSQDQSRKGAEHPNVKTTPKSWRVLKRGGGKPKQLENEGDVHLNDSSSIHGTSCEIRSSLGLQQRFTAPLAPPPVRLLPLRLRVLRLLSA